MPRSAWRAGVERPSGLTVHPLPRQPTTRIAMGEHLGHIHFLPFCPGPPKDHLMVAPPLHPAHGRGAAPCSTSACWAGCILSRAPSSSRSSCSRELLARDTAPVAGRRVGLDHQHRVACGAARERARLLANGAFSLREASGRAQAGPACAVPGHRPGLRDVHSPLGCEPGHGLYALLRR